MKPPVQDSEPPSAFQETVRNHLEKVLQSSALAKAGAQRAFLRFTVEQTLLGNHESIKEVTIAVEAFGKADFDPKEKAAVRNTASRLRKSLEAYYSGEGSADSVRITFDLGSYVPRFVVLPPDTPEPNTPAPKSRRPHRLRLLIGIAAAGILICIGLISRNSKAVITVPTLTSYPLRETSPSFSPDGTQIVFHSRGENGRSRNAIHRRLIEGGLTTRLTNLPDQDDRNPSWSPDGKLIAFLRNVGSTKGAIHLITPEGKELGRLTKASGTTVTWDPTSRYLAFMDGVSHDHPYSITIVDVQSGKTQIPVVGSHSPSRPTAAGSPSPMANSATCSCSTSNSATVSGTLPEKDR